MIHENWLVVKNIPGIIGADMIVVIENNVLFRRRIHTWVCEQEFARLIRKRFSIFSIIWSEILRFPHHLCISSRCVYDMPK